MSQAIKKNKISSGDASSEPMLSNSNTTSDTTGDANSDLTSEDIPRLRNSSPDLREDSLIKRTKQRLKFDPSILSSIVGGLSALDMPKLNVHNLEEAEAFVKGYGFLLSEPEQSEKLWYYHRRALVLLNEKLGFELSEIPDEIKDSKKLKNLANLLVWASQKDSKDPRSIQLQKWSCAVLRVMHVFIHSESDLFSSFSEDIQKSIITPIQNCIYYEGTSGQVLLRRPLASSKEEAFSKNKISSILSIENSLNSDSFENDEILLSAFEVKSFKTSSSTVIKLLAKSYLFALNIFDHLGVRFITKSVFDSFLVLRFLIEENLVSYPHIMPDQSSNMLYPVDLFLEACEELSERKPLPTDEEVNNYLKMKLEVNKEKLNFVRKENFFSGQDYRFIKFISRKLISIPKNSQNQREFFPFFFPFEVQIMDEASYKKILSGPSQHNAYKERQILAARKRVLPE